MYQEILRESQLYSVNPLVGCIDNFVPQKTIVEIEAALKAVDLQSAAVASSTGAVVSENRTAENYKIRPGTIPVVEDVTDKIARLFRLKNNLCEYPEFISYQEGGEFQRHFDAALSGSMPSRRTDNTASSQRVFTGVLYLNQDFSGGTTRFPRLDVELQPKLGRLAFWQNTKPGAATVHTLSMHQGCPVTKGNKRIITFWFRDNPWDPVNIA
ncbi:prolyl hydroxylase family protein [Parasedimentitalea marina]|uniref:prolyl hydroxylase family protein n=1 Tax=Parasedimentitalea marina TaxID=2483033 RepID=UPI0013E31CE2|nr:2OG-Fe(II) oxygenase [Parasedimentitalea marina]